GGGENLEIGTPSLYLDLGRALLIEGRNAEALDAFAGARPFAADRAAMYAGAAEANRRLGRNDEALVATIEALLVEPGRSDLHSSLYELYQQVDPSGCGFTREGSQVRLHPDCPAARAWVCRAYADLVPALLAMKNATRDARVEAAEKF